MERFRQILISILIGAVAFGNFLPLAARAAEVSGFSDTMSTQSQGAPSEHRVLFVTSSGIDVWGDTITLTFGSSGSFDLSSITPNDVDLSVDVGAPIGDCAGTFAQKTLAASPAPAVRAFAASAHQLSSTPP